MAALVWSTEFHIGHINTALLYYAGNITLFSKILNCFVYSNEMNSLPVSGVCVYDK